MLVVHVLFVYFVCNVVIYILVVYVLVVCDGGVRPVVCWEYVILRFLLFACTGCVSAGCVHANCALTLLPTYLCWLCVCQLFSLVV